MALFNRRVKNIVVLRRLNHYPALVYALEFINFRFFVFRLVHTEPQWIHDVREHGRKDGYARIHFG